jgi:hypothetical protein
MNLKSTIDLSIILKMKSNKIQGESKRFGSIHKNYVFFLMINPKTEDIVACIKKRIFFKCIKNNDSEDLFENTRSKNVKRKSSNVRNIERVMRKNIMSKG